VNRNRSARRAAVRPWLLCALAAALAAPACSSPGATGPTDASPSPAAAPPTSSAAAAAPTAPPASAAPAAPPASAAPTEPSSPGIAPPEGRVGGEAPSTAPAVPAAEAPLPEVKVTNIGMHIGGGPHDAVTKAPIKLSVEPHFDEFRRCFALVDDPKKGGDFGVDLRIEREGGKAQVTKPRTALKGEGFSACVIGVFEKIDFRKPKGGATVVSYSLRFTPR